MFKDYIAEKKSRWEEGTSTITADQLMAFAEKRYATLVLAKTWAAPSDEQQELVVLTAKIAELNKQVANTKQPKKGPFKKEKGGIQHPKKKGVKGKKGKQGDAKFAWKMVPPKEGAPRTKQVEGKTYNFCPNHGDKGMWVIHQVSECKARQQAPSPNVHGSADPANVGTY